MRWPLVLLSLVSAWGDFEYDSAGQPVLQVGAMQDITERKAAAGEIEHLAFYDPLTGLPNRRLLLDRLRQAVASSTRTERHGALLFLDLDNFKALNDTLGHDIGDLLLQQVAQRLVGCVREGDTVARLGGDEFVLMLEDLSENSQEAATQTESVGEKILAVLNQPYQLEAQRYHNTPSIGVTLFVDHDGSVDELMKRADMAMYQAKAAGRNTLRFFDPVMQAEVTTRVALEPVGNYAVQPSFSDGHDSGIFTWDYLYFLGSQQDKLWADYQARLAKAGVSRDAAM